MSATTEARPVLEDEATEPVAETAIEETPGKTAQRPAPTRSARSATTLAEEGRLLGKAHQLIQSGQPQQALEVLRLFESRYPRSVLVPEREVLTIEALGAAGEAGLARQRAQRFLKRSPNSAYVARLQRFVE